MTLGELIGLLGEYRDEHGEDCEVRLMTQQNWPFENRIAGVTSTIRRGMTEATRASASLAAVPSV